jgi:hypothetical protein
MLRNGLPRTPSFQETEFFRRWMRAADAMSPQESAAMLTCASQHLFVGMLRTLRAEDCAPFTDTQLQELYRAVWNRLESKAGKSVELFEGLAPTGNA